jgi:hypothetical protein
MGKILDWIVIKASQAALPHGNFKPKPKHTPKPKKPKGGK